MGQVLIRKLSDETLAAYRLAAQHHGRSLEAELRDAIERQRPMRPKDPEKLGALSRRLRAMTPPDGPDPIDSTSLIRWDRDTDHGRDVDDGWTSRRARR
jgi:plasmid stability protein